MSDTVAVSDTGVCFDTAPAAYGSWKAKILRILAFWVFLRGFGK